MQHIRQAATLTAMVFLGTVTPVAAQTPNRNESGGQAAATRVDATHLPLNLSRIQRGLEQRGDLTRWRGLNLEVYVTVSGEAPPLLVLPVTDTDRVFVGPPADGAPTHEEMRRSATPKEFQSPVMDFSGLLRWLRDRSK